jgi:hypothetical protein
MQSLKEILDQMGFNKDASIDTQKAFLKHLVSSANQTRPKPMPAKHSGGTQDLKPQAVAVATETSQGQAQLEFNFDEDKRVS